MPKIDWTPGSGRRGRPLRKVLGMGQRQGLLVLSGLAGVSILVAGYLAIGGDGTAGAASQRSGASGGHGSAGVNGGAAVEVPADPAKAVRTLQASTQHYADLFAQGQKIVGHMRYPDQKAFGQAFTDPKSPAALFAAYRVTPNPEADTSYSAAAAAAVAAYGSHRPSAAVATWSADMVRAKADLSAWIGVAVRYQTGTAAQGELDAAAAKVTADLAAAKTDAAAAGS